VVRRLSIAIVSIALSLVGAVGAGAVSFPLNVEFDDGLLGSFGNVEVTEAGGDLDFEITLDASLGASRDLHELYFNLEDGFTGIAISSTDVVSTAYTLDADPSVAGGAGSSFDFGVNFGNGAGAPGNDALQSATFSLSADQALSIGHLLISSSTSQGIEVFFAIHAQGTSLVPDAESETVGSLVPEPGTLTLVLVGLAGLCGATQRRRA
jgi:PEP-CTERM motif-containing protein